MDAGALDAHGHAQVDGGPARLLLPAVTAPLVPRAPEGHGEHRRPLGGGARGGFTSTRERGELFRLQMKTLEYLYSN